MKSPGKITAMLVTLLLIPAVPFVLWGAALEGMATAWIASGPSRLVLAGVTIGLLAADIFLPVPSSVISTYAGVELGWLGGSLCSWCGLSVGNLIGFALARRWGNPWLAKKVPPTDLLQLHVLIERRGAGALVITRAIPLLAEATVLLSGVAGMSWSRFLPATLCSNLGLAMAYAALGSWAQQQAWIAWALAVAAALPVLLTAFARRLLSPAAKA